MLERLTDQLEKEARDLRILEAVIDHQPIGIVRLSTETDIPEHKVRYSLRMLENDGFVEATPQGAVPADDIADRVDGVNDGLDELAERVASLRENGIGAEAEAGPGA